MLVNVILIILVIALIRCFISNRISQKGNVELPFLDKSGTDALKGFSIVMIALAHICQYEPRLSDFLIGGTLIYRMLFSGGAIGVSVFFLLSGYGCYCSVSKKDRYGKWLLKHIIKMIVHFSFAFFVVIALCIVCLDVPLNWKEVMLEYVTLRMPGSTVWYFKIQLLFYIFLAIAAKIGKKNESLIVAGFSLGYALVADYVLGLPDFWWKTTLCFSAGCFLAQYKDKIDEYVKKYSVKILILVMACGSYLFMMNDGYFRIYVQLPAYVLISLSIVLFWDWLIKGNAVLRVIGKGSLDIYLVHIGIVEYVFLLRMKLDFKILLFICVAVIAAWFCYYVSVFVDKKVTVLYGG